MSRIAARFAELKRAGRTALVTYITAGDPGKQATVPLMHAMVTAGADALELGVPFSDPSADGPVIQAACERALAAGTTLKDVLAMVREFRAKDTATPVILMGYLNPMEAMGAETFVAAAAEAGVDGVLTVDMPPEEAEPLAGLLRAKG
ncbi:MAG TPA: tryptophan synthase subunit alpha, partial [Gammaproteobacteria bacterium]|nr:tryptophan synthase subunit alpha [Gammaproteobacteria bacterium]